MAGRSFQWQDSIVVQVAALSCSNAATPQTVLQRICVPHFEKGACNGT